MTHAELILLAAAELDNDGEEFLAEDLAVRVFLRHPEAFALDGFPQYLATHKVFSKLYGHNGLTGHRGHLELLGTRRLRMTAAGRKVARELARRVA